MNWHLYLTIVSWIIVVLFSTVYVVPSNKKPNPPKFWVGPALILSLAYIIYGWIN